MKKQLFIAFEGIDGSGKSTQLRLLSESLKNAGYKVYCTFEPTDSPIGSVIRNILNHRIEADNKTIAGLFVADRLDHLLNKTSGILKKLNEGFTVITDRYYFSSYAYHSSHMPMDWIIQANSLSADLLRPDITVFIDVDPELSIKRLNSGRSSIDLFENIDNLKKVKEKYFKAFEKLKDIEKVCIVDGNRSLDTIAENILQLVAPLYS
jgi:dTMP kinase